MYAVFAVGRLRAPCYGMLPGLMVGGPYCWTCAESMLWHFFEVYAVNMFRAHVVGRVRGPCCGKLGSMAGHILISLILRGALSLHQG